jgi:hypothetical protein
MGAGTSNLHPRIDVACGCFVRSWEAAGSDLVELWLISLCVGIVGWIAQSFALPKV